MSGAQRAAFQEMSLDIAAQGWLRNGNAISLVSCADERSSRNHSPTEQDNNRITFGRNEAKHKHVLAATVVALGCGLAEGALGMQDDFLVLGTNEVIDDVRGRGIATRVAEPFGADETLYDGGRVVNPTVAIVFVGQRGLASDKTRCTDQHACGGRST